MLWRTNALRTFGFVLLYAIARPAGGVEPLTEVLLWPAGHAANLGEGPKVVGTPEWAERVTRSPAITPFLASPDKRTGAAIVICPGGGYSGLAMEKEGLDTARWLQQRGIAGIVLRYRCGGGKNQQPVPLEDAQRAIRVVRSRAAEWGIDPERVGVLGFSAGGHLASCAATMFDEGDADSDDPVQRHSSRPDAAMLIYPVIDMHQGKIAHAGSRKNLLGENAADSVEHHWSTQTRVTEQTPPTFLVHAHDDKSVPAFNSMLFYEQLLAHRIPAELHVYETGGHGFGLFRGDQAADKWPLQLEPWLRKRGMLPAATAKDREKR